MDRKVFIEKAFDEIDRITKVRINLSKESDRGCALLSVSYLDNMLKGCIQSFLVDDENVVSDIIGTSRALGAFSNRIDMAYLLGIISLKQRRELHLIRKIRNEFGHSYENISFETNSIKNRVQELSFNNLVYKNMRSKFIKEVTVHMGILGAYVNSINHIKKREDEDNNIEFLKKMIRDKDFIESNIDNFLEIKAKTENNNDFIENNDWRELLLNEIEGKAIENIFLPKDID